jgi:1-acyl-sn-glycerol-3-phosphate acyltransferase
LRSFVKSEIAVLDENKKNKRAWSCPVLATVRLLLVSVWTLLVMLFYVVYRLFVRDQDRRYRTATAGTHVWGRGCCWLMGYKITVEGAPPEGGALVAPNHLGYADIILLSACCRCLFVAKSEVEGWTLFGQGAKLYQHIFVERRRAHSMMETRNAVVERLESGHNVCIFLEGTSSGGVEILPFRSSFIQPAIDAGAPVVPVAVTWSARSPKVDVSEDVAYWKDHVFFPHLFRHLGLRGIRANVVFCDPLDSSGANRKELAEAVRDWVVDAWKGGA